MRRQALVVGVEGPATDPADESPPQWQPLIYATQHSRRLREVLAEQYAYLLLEPVPDPASTAAALEDALTHAVKDRADFTIIHVLAHGKLARETRKVYAVGGDGRLTTDSLSRWVDMAERPATAGEDAPAVLLVLDLCHAGAVSADQLRSLLHPNHRRVWVLAACQTDEPAYDGRLSIAVDEVLRGFASGALPLDESLPYIPIARFCREVARHVEGQSAGGIQQTVVRPLAPLGDDLSHLRFFPNPRHDPAGSRFRSGVDPAVFTVLDDVADTRHFVIRAAGGEERVDITVPSFTGRSDELRALTGWLEGQGASLRVVTGVPGVGKSALVGALACAAHPLLREATEQVWRTSGGDLPGMAEGLAVVHARRRRVPEILSSLAAQWGVESPGPGLPWTTHRLMVALHARPEPPSLIVDAVDEAEHPADLVATVLSPLASARRPDGQPLCRMLVATRPETGLGSLIETARAQGGLIDLGEVPVQRLRKDLVHFVRRTLRPADGRVSPWCSLAAAESLGETLADTLLSGTREWGEFLVAGLYLRLLRDRGTPPATKEEAETLGRAVPRSLDGVLDLDLELAARPGLHEMLATLAWAEGAGMPESLLGHVAAVKPGSAGEEQPDTAHLLYAVRFYLRRNVDREGTPVYRLFHQGLADRLRERSELNAATVWERLLATVGTTGSGRRRWASTEPYLLRHAARHSALAGRLGELLQDGEFLVHADPAPLAEELYHGEGGPHGAVYLTSYGAHHSGPPDQRRDILAVDATRHQQYRLAAELTQDTGRRILWTAGRSLHTGLLTTLTGHRGMIRDLTTLEIHGRPHALTAGQDGTARLWDLASAAPTLELDHHGSPVGGVVAGRTDGGRLAVTGCDNGELRGWDLATGHLLWTVRAHRGPVRSLVAVRYGWTPAVASAGGDRVIHYWDIATGAHLSSVEVSALITPVKRMSCVALEGKGDYVVAQHDIVEVLSVQGDKALIPPYAQPHATYYCFLDLGEGLEPVQGDSDGNILAGPAILNADHADAVNDLAAVALDGSVYVLSGGADGIARLTHTDGSSRQVASHTTAITRVAVVPEAHGTRILTASEGGTVRVSDAAGHEIPQRHPGHTHAINALTLLPDGRLVSCSEDGTLALWNAESGVGHRVLLYRDDIPAPDRATSVAVLEAGEHPRILASCALDGIALWDTNAQENHLHRRIFDDGFRASVVLTVTARGTTFAVHASESGEVAVSGVDHVNRMFRQDDTDSAEPGEPDVPERVLLPESGCGPCLSLAATPNRVLAGYHSGHVRSAHLLEPSRPQIHTQHSAAVHTVAAVSIDAQPYVVSGDDKGEVRVTALDSTRAFTLAGHTRAVFASAPVLLDGHPHLFTGGLDRSLRLWDLRNGSQIDAFWFPDSVFAIAVAHDGALYLGVGPDIIHMTLGDHLHLRPCPTPDRRTPR
ncbi:AAA family ATPase [Streptomyces sp. PTY087I2]|uniref:AAA family ATPase n=1 Tax=Streptomyces sp. PTY087I2 TaxID=1819298 RepID=UPI0008274843|nr:AAA family ATPase [Streptomyces sp. PTY087I2]OCC13351.1 WD domain, G-beta repeat [Streptomyces sp. PTY087I2]